MNRVTILVDGFNLYHSIVQAQQDNGGRCVKWLDLRALCESFLPAIRLQRGVSTALERIYYFSALPKHRSHEQQLRHSLYMRCLAGSGIEVCLGRFKSKSVRCPICNKESIRHEEKETDVAIATRLFEVCYADDSDSIVLLTGDTDVAPTVRTCNRLFPAKFICFAFPYKRQNRELKQLSPGSFNISHEAYLKYQFVNPLILPDGIRVTKPLSW
jgi:uncharacterized LabA/DUF88 family protein